MKRVGQVYRENLAKHIKQRVDGSQSTFVLSYSRLSSPKISELRKNLKKAGANVSVVRNSIAKIVLQESKQDELAQKLQGQTAFIWSNQDAVEVSKVLIQFTKDLENINIRGGLLEGRFLKQDDVTKLSALPAKPVLFSMLLGTIQAPVSRLMGALNAKSRDLLSILKQLSEKKGGN